MSVPHTASYHRSTLATLVKNAAPSTLLPATRPHKCVEGAERIENAGDARKRRRRRRRRGGAALVAVSIDVNTLHVVAPSIDDAARHWASNHAAGNENSLGRVLSDIAPGLGVPCAAASLALVARRGADALRVVAPLGIGFGAFVQGFSGVLKDATQRLRPDPLHHSTYSFPSSHTASATFLAGAFLAVLLPALLDDDEEDFWAWTPQTITSVASITALTAAGRILTESHFPQRHARRRRARDGGSRRDRVGRRRSGWRQVVGRADGVVGVAALGPPGGNRLRYATAGESNALPRKAQGMACASRTPAGATTHAVRAFFAAGLREAIVFSTKSMTASPLFSRMSLRWGTLSRSVKAFSGGTDLASSPRAALMAAGNLPWWAQAKQMTGPAPS